MKNNEFFRALRSQENHTWGEVNALDAWHKGIEKHLDFPLLTNSIWEKDIADFLKSMNEAGIKKFGFYARSTLAVENIVAFTKAGWKFTGIIKFNDHLQYDWLGLSPLEGLVFENLQ